MSKRRNLALGIASGAVAAGGFAAAVGLAEARQSAPVVTRFLLGYFNSANKFVPTAGRNATNVDRNAVAMFVFSGAIDTGPKRRASLPLTLDEQAALTAAQLADPDFDLAHNGYEPGTIPRKLSNDRGAFYVATGSVSTDSVVIASPQIGGALSSAPGAFFKAVKGRGTQVIPDRLLFNPRYIVSTFSQPEQIDYNPQGLDASTTYDVGIDGGANPSSAQLVTNLDGSPLSVPFFTTFTTSNGYVQDYNRPQAISISPEANSTNVLSDADVELSFSEPMDLTTFVPPRFQGDDAWTVIVRYSTNPINGVLVGQNLLISVRVKPQTGGDVIQLRPLQGFGIGPYEIELIVRNGVTDLAGNNITRQQQITFKTVYDPNAEIAGLVQETFNNNAQQDTSFGTTGNDQPSGDDLLAIWWNSTTPPAGGVAGFILGQLKSINFVAFDNPAASSIAAVNIFQASPFDVQFLYGSAAMGGRPRTITGFAWYATALTGFTYPNTAVRMGHANSLIASSGFPGLGAAAAGPSFGYFGDTPVLVAPSQTYKTTLQAAGGYFPGPAFALNFPFDGSDSVIMELAHGGNGATPHASGDERWQCDINYALPTCTFINLDSNPVYAGSGTRTWYFNSRFTYLTPGAEAESHFYDFGRDDARLLPQQIVPATQPQGSAVTFLWQGAKSDVVNPLNPDLSTLTGWLPDVRSLSNYRYVRFRVTLINNLSTKAIPSIDTLLIPFTHH